MKRRRVLALLAGLLIAAPLQAVHDPESGPELVLVASVRSPIEALTLAETRKLYLGVPLLVGQQRVHPLRNNTNAVVQEIFMQKVLFMSTPTYERQVLSRVFRMGGTRPPEYASLRELLAALEADPNAVTYVLRAFAELQPGLKVVGTF